MPLLCSGGPLSHWDGRIACRAPSEPEQRRGIILALHRDTCDSARSRTLESDEPEKSPATDSWASTSAYRPASAAERLSCVPSMFDSLGVKVPHPT
jgi:hypothetical protein